MQFNMKPVYQFFSPVDGFAEFVVVISLAAMITLAFMGKLTDSFAGALTAIGSLGVIHDNCAAWIATKLAKRDHDAGN
jgi:hypothetical protein